MTYNYPYNQEMVRAMAYQILECEIWADDLERTRKLSWSPLLNGSRVLYYNPITLC